jgi:hypothetical protein
LRTIRCREAEDGRRELILSSGKFGYVAKYRWVPAEDVVLILAVRRGRPHWIAAASKSRHCSRMAALAGVGWYGAVFHTKITRGALGRLQRHDP